MYLRVCGVLLASILLFAGCQQKNDENALPTQDTNNKYVQVKNSDPRERQNLDNEQLAIHLSNVASDVPNVNSATAIIAGPYAVVGIDVDEHLDRSRVGTIKYSVAEALQHDPYGKTAVVVADGDVTERIRLMSMKMREGYPIQGIVDELSAIIGRYMPELPINEDRAPEPDQNKEIIPDHEKDQLDDIQNDQAKE